MSVASKIKARTADASLKLMRLILDEPIYVLVIVFLVGANLSPILPEQFFVNSITLVSGIGFTMLGFGLAATSILTSVISTPTIMRLRLSAAWKDLTSTFTRSNVIFLLLGVFGLVIYKELFNEREISGQFLRAIYIGLLISTLFTAIAVIYVLHRIVSAEPTDEEKKVAEAAGLPNFAPPPPSALAKHSADEGAVTISGLDPNEN